MAVLITISTQRVFADVAKVRAGVGGVRRDLPHGTADLNDDELHAFTAAVADNLDARGELTWRALVEARVQAAFAEPDPGLLRRKLVELMALCSEWVEAIDHETAAALLAEAEDRQGSGPVEPSLFAEER
ncbi:hypothetical protein [Saccharothrix hoggarensis]|uniref:Uncharacterized protein n=1 Tax=Saccharothrix hoggarensis TaxID=913853 RepID=A0ABW3QIM6_9PSEU